MIRLLVLVLSLYLSGCAVEKDKPTALPTKHIEGWVKVEFTITKEGTVKDAKVVDSQPDKRFNHSALRAISRWKLKPMVVDGIAVEKRATQLLTFKLKK